MKHAGTKAWLQKKIEPRGDNSVDEIMKQKSAERILDAGLYRSALQQSWKSENKYIYAEKWQKSSNWRQSSKQQCKQRRLLPKK